jgi:hypothetical protein
LDGWVVMLGATVAGFTVKDAGLLMMLFTAFVTITRKDVPLSPVTVGGVVYLPEFAPEMFTLFFCH